MIRRGTLIVMIILVVLIGVTWLLEWSPSGKARTRGTPTSTPYPSLFSWDVDNLNIIDITISGNIPVTLRRNPDDTWGFSVPQGLIADQGQVLQLISSLQTINVQASLDSNVSLDMLGLENPPQVFKLQTSDGTNYILKIGQITPTNMGYYCQVNDNPVVVLSKGAIDSLLELATVDALLLPTPTIGLETPFFETTTPSP
jgi:hypothetical protein